MSGPEFSRTIDWDGALDEQVHQSLDVAREKANGCGCPNCHKAVLAAARRIEDLNAFNGRGIDPVNQDVSGTSSLKDPIQRFYERNFGATGFGPDNGI